MKKKVDYEAINPIHGSVNYMAGLTYMAKKNRHSPTEAENIIWQKILRYEKTGYKFSRQKPINRFILDFYCSKLNLAIEIDGGSHVRRKKMIFYEINFYLKLEYKLSDSPMKKYYLTLIK